MWQFKRDELPANDAGLTICGYKSVKYKACSIGKTNAAGGHTLVKNIIIAVPLKYSINFWRSLELPLIKGEVHLELTWIENCLLLSAGDSATFKITDTKLYVPIVTLFTEDKNLAKQLKDGFKRSIYWNAKLINNETNVYELFSASFQGVKRIFVLCL